MFFGLSEEQLLIQESFRGLLTRAVDLDRLRKNAAGGHGTDAALMRELATLGLPGLLISEEYGGSGLTLIEAAIVGIELGRAAAPVPFAGTAVMAPRALSRAGSPAQRQEWLPKLASGEITIGIAVAEYAAGARRDATVKSQNNRLNGKASFVLDGADAAAFIIADSAGNLYLLRGDAPGVKKDVLPSIDPTRPLAELTLEDAPAEPLPNGTPAMLDALINAGRVILAAESFGAGEEMLRRAVDYAKERQQFGRVVGSFQAVKHMCAEMAAELQPCQSLVWYSAYAADHLPEDAALSALLTKSHMDETGRFVARTAIEVHGGMGYTDLMGLHYWFKRIGFNRATFGGPEIIRMRAAELQGFVAGAA